MDPSDAGGGALIGAELGRYRLEALIGSGGMAHVYRAKDPRNGSAVAVKVLIDGTSPQFGVRERFDREWRMMRRIVHPSIVRVLDGPEPTGGPLYYVMELLEGETLAQRLESDGRLALDVALEVFTQIAEGLSAVHAAGSVHRDIKPQNIFLSEGRTGELSVKILDFGLARVFGSQITGAGIMVGTPAYVSPEQASGDRIDERADIYALGLLMYRVLTGHHPFTSDDQVTTLGHQILSAPPPLSWLEETVPPPLEALVLKMLRKRPDDRPTTMEGILRALASLSVDSSTDLDAYGPRPSNPSNDSYAPLNPLAESLVNNALVPKGFRKPR